MSAEDHKMDLIAKVLSGRATAVEKQQLQQWMEAEPANRQEYEELARIWEESVHLASAQSFDTETGWAKLAARVNEAGDTQAQQQVSIALKNDLAAGNIAADADTREKPAAPIKRYRWAIPIAASLLAVGIIGWIWWGQSSGTAWKTLTAEHNQTFQLADGSSVKMRKGATLFYQEKFEGNERQVKLSGEAFFDVRRDEAHPFVITTDNAAIKVLGTSFLVNTSSGKDEVIVVTGRVSVASKNNSQKKVEITAGQRALLQRDEFEQTAVTDSNFIAWNTGRIEFQNTPLEKALEDLSDYYEVPIELDSHNIAPGSNAVTARFDQLTLEQALGEIALFTGLSMKKEGSKIIFYMK